MQTFQEAQPAERLSQIPFSSRISARAVTASVFSIYAVLILFMTLGAALGLWNLDFTEISGLSTGFWAWSFLSWIAAVFLGGLVAAVGSRSALALDGMLNAFTAWAVACVLGCAFVAIATGRVFNFMADATKGMYWGSFFAGVLAIAAALIGGWLGARWEARAPSVRRETEAFERDPVCGMEVSPTTAAATSQYQGQTFYFCSQNCKVTFDRKPESYRGKRVA